MDAISYSDVFEINDGENAADPIHAGDIVRMGTNAFPCFTVVAVHGDKAWVRNPVTSQDAVTSLTRCRKVAA
jgi:hypothetical protein